MNMPKHNEILLGNHRLMLKNANPKDKGKKQRFLLMVGKRRLQQSIKFEALSETEQNKILNNIENLPRRKNHKIKQGKTYVF